MCVISDKEVGQISVKSWELLGPVVGGRVLYTDPEDGENLTRKHSSWATGT